MYDDLNIRNILHPVAVVKNGEIIRCNKKFIEEIGNFSRIDQIKDFKIILIPIGNDTEIAIPVSFVDEVEKMRSERFLKLFSSLADLIYRIESIDNVANEICNAVGSVFECVFTESNKQYMKCPSCDKSCGAKEFELVNGKLIVGGEIFEEEEKMLSGVSYILSVERRSRNDRVELAKQLLKNLSQFEFLADKLRNPLAIIKGLLEVREDLNSDYIFKTIEEQVERMERTLDSLNKAEERTYNLVKKCKED